MKLPGSYKSVRFLAFAIGGLASLFYFFFLAGEGIGDILEGRSGAIPILVMILFTVSGYIISWFRIRKGALIMITGAMITGGYLLIAGAKGNVLMALVFVLPFLIPGLFFLTLKHLGKTEKKSGEQA